MTDEGRKLLIKFEGLELKSYKDSAGLLTIGVGHLLTSKELSSGMIKIGSEDVEYYNGITEAQCFALLDQDIAPAARAVEECVKVPLNENQKDALTIFVFNIGAGAFKSSTLLHQLNLSQYDAVPFQLSRWNKAGGKVVQGLINRRAAEAKLWSTPSKIS